MEMSSSTFSMSPCTFSMSLCTFSMSPCTFSMLKESYDVQKRYERVTSLLQMKSSLFCDFKKRSLLVSVRRFGATYVSRLQGSNIPRSLLLLPIYAACNPKSADINPVWLNSDALISGKNGLIRSWLEGVRFNYCVEPGLFVLLDQVQAHK